VRERKKIWTKEAKSESANLGRHKRTQEQG